MSNTLLLEAHSEKIDQETSTGSSSAPFTPYILHHMEDLYVFEANPTAQETVDNEFGSLFLITD